ncbi:hypothetical protein BDR22DRAFT_886096 [Usnea florida]
MDPAVQAVPLGGFWHLTAEQKASFLAMTQEMLEEQKKTSSPLPTLPKLTQLWVEQFIPSAPQAQKEEDEQSRQKPLYQVTVEVWRTWRMMQRVPRRVPRNTVAPGLTARASLPCLCTIRASGDQSARLSNALLSAHQHTSFLATSLAYSITS